MKTFYVVDSLPGPTDGFALIPDGNLVTGIAEMSRELDVELTTLEMDLLTLAAAIFAVDLASLREEREGFVRDLRLVVPLVNHQAFRAHAEEIATILYLLSSDNWQIEVTARRGEQEEPRAWPVASGKTLLFSGGLDSLSAAVELLEDNRELDLLLASHYTRNRVTQTSQAELFGYLRDAFGPRVTRVAVRVAGQSSGSHVFPRDAEREPTQRTRSFLFLAIAAIASRRRGFHELLMMAENGQMAIHVPLTAARLGAFSTRTAHPEFLHEMENLLSTILGFSISIRNPFVYRTKAECIERTVTSHASALAMSVSCWSSARHALPHCGRCVPCLIRRIAIESHGIRLAEYQRDLFSEDLASLSETDEGKRNFVDIAELVLRFGGSFTDGQLQEQFPDLRNAHIDVGDAIAMYRRFSHEAAAVFANYPAIGSFL